MTLARVHRLTIRIDRAGTNYPEVRLLVDGDDLLARDGHDRGNDPADILDTGALLPADPPRRIAFYRRRDLVEWSDVRDLTGVYLRAARARGRAGPAGIASPRPARRRPRTRTHRARPTMALSYRSTVRISASASISSPTTVASSQREPAGWAR